MTDTAIALRPPAQPVVGGMDREQLELLKRTVCENATDDEYLMFVGICKRTGLDPFSKQIYFRKYNTKNGPRVTVITGIDGYRLMAQRTGEYEGQVGPQWCGADGVWKDVWLENKPPAACRIGVWRTKFREPAYAIAKWTEYYPSNPVERFIWDKMPSNQLAKCAEALSLRKAFPHELSGLYVKEEMDQAEPPKGGADPKASGAGATSTDVKTSSSPAPTASSTTSRPTSSTAGTPGTTPKKLTAADIPHDGTKASHKQVAYLHQLRPKLGGFVYCTDKAPCYDVDGRKKVPKLCDYHTKLAVFRDQAGQRIKSSTALAEPQISFFISWAEAKLEKQATKSARQPDIAGIADGTIVPEHDSLAEAVEVAVHGDVEASERLLGAILDDYRVMSLRELSPENARAALQRLLKGDWS